jgi:short subunit fatty acids transporter
MLERIGSAAERFVRRSMPDPFLPVLLLTIVTFGVAFPLVPVAFPSLGLTLLLAR